MVLESDRKICDLLWQYQNDDGHLPPDFEVFEFRSRDFRPHYDEHVNEMLYAFAQTGSGGLYALWTVGRHSPVVYVCDEGTDSAVLAECMTEFLRLISVGYTFFYPDSDYDEPLSNDELGEDDQLSVRHFQNWLISEFGLSIPNTGDSILAPARLGYPRFRDWLDEHNICTHDPPTDHFTNAVGHRIANFSKRWFGFPK